MLDKDPKLGTTLASPVLKLEDKKLVVVEALKASGSDKMTGKLLELLAENNRLALVSGIIEKFDVFMRWHRNEIKPDSTASIVSSAPLGGWREIISWSKRLIKCWQQFDAEALNKLKISISKFITGELKTTNKVCCPSPLPN